MTKPSTFTKAALAAVAGVMALGGAVAAQAQPYGGYAPNYSSGGYYDPCRRDEGNRGLMGAFIGGAGGATLGSQFAASGHRRDGSLLGGVVGALAGAAIGKNTAACSPGYAPPPPPQSSYNGYAPAPYASDDRYSRYDNRYDDDDAYRGGDRYRVAQRPNADGCTLAESPILMPDGRTQMHFVRVCLDRNGRYQVVN
jgi:hypothetical protein